LENHGFEHWDFGLRMAALEGALYSIFLFYGCYLLLRSGKCIVLVVAAGAHIVVVSGLVLQFENLEARQLLSSALWSAMLITLLCLRPSRQFYQTRAEATLCERGSGESTFTPRQWWTEHELVNGVFKGGGAKGIAYAGALQAMDERRLWFGSVAGTSAGAITATLIACGCSPQDMRSNVPSLLKSIKPTKIKMIFGTHSTLFDSRTLRIKLEQILCDSLKRPLRMESPVTFRELYNAHSRKISLYVVALDLSRAAPVVFSVHSTPDVSVSGAVMASSAIPVGFPSVRGIFRRGQDIWVQRLVDGGAWANLPRFVYYDPSFAAWITKINPTADLYSERERPTVGFALGLDDTTIIQPDMLTLDSTGTPELDRGTTQETASRSMWLFGEVFSSQMMRFLMAMSLISIATLLFVNTHNAVNSFWNLLPEDVRRLESEFKPTVAILYVGTVLMGCVLPLIAVCFSRPLGDVLIPAGRAALAVGTGVAPWVGAAEDDHIVRLDPGNLKTTDFDPKAVDQSAAIEDARSRTLDYIDGYLRPKATAESSTDGSESLPVLPSGSVLEQENSRWRRVAELTPRIVSDLVRLYMSPILTCVLVVIALVMFVYAGKAIVYRGSRDLDYWAAAVLALVSLVVIGWLVTTMMMRWQRDLARRPVKYTRITRLPGVVMIFVGFVIAVGIPLKAMGLPPFFGSQHTVVYPARVIDVLEAPTDDNTAILLVDPVKASGAIPNSQAPRKIVFTVDESNTLPGIGDVIDVRVKTQSVRIEDEETGGVVVVWVLTALWLVRAGMWPLRVIGRHRGLLSIRY
jgi:predicted acylesterase/phospholipase RssA